MPIFPAACSLLFVPGVRPELFAKAAKSGAHALVLDLEDSVPPAVKDQARQAVRDELATPKDSLTFVRINHPSLGALEADLSVLAARDGQVIMAPKIEGPEDLIELDDRLAAFERRAGLDADTVSVMVVVESGLGLRRLFDTLTSAPRVRGAGLASAEEGDLMVDIGGRWTPTGEALAYARGKFVCDARAARAQWVIDGAFMNMADEGAFERECDLARTYGFTGKIAIHPRQTPAINRAFAPSEAEIERARALLEAFHAAEAAGCGAIRFRGMMVDYANAKRAEQILALAETS